MNKVKIIGGGIVLGVLLLVLIPFFSGTEGDYIESWKINVVHNSPYGLTTDNTYIWISDLALENVYIYWKNGTYITNWALTGNWARGLCNNGTDIWSVSYQDELIRRYDIDGNYIEGWDISGQVVAGWGLATDETYIWVNDYTNDQVWKYWMNGTYTGDNFDTAASGNDDPRGMTYYDGYLWISEQSENIYKYYTNGTYITNWAPNASNVNPGGLANNGTDLWIGDNTYDGVFRYELIEAPVDTCTCPGAGENWEIDMSDYCNITDACDLTTGTLSFTGAGWCNCNASVDTTNLGDPGASGILYIQDSCIITID